VYIRLRKRFYLSKYTRSDPIFIRLRKRFRVPYLLLTAKDKGISRGCEGILRDSDVHQPLSRRTYRLSFRRESFCSLCVGDFSSEKGWAWGFLHKIQFDAGAKVSSSAFEALRLESVTLTGCFV
jgi:hypothetical protein